MIRNRRLLECHGLAVGVEGGGEGCFSSGFDVVPENKKSDITYSISGLYHIHQTLYLNLQLLNPHLNLGQ